MSRKPATSNQIMEMLYFSPDRAEVERVRETLAGAGISCEVRDGSTVEGIIVNAADAELWIQNDQDTHRALMLCVELGLGFAKRTHPADLIEAEREL